MCEAPSETLDKALSSITTQEVATRCFRHWRSTLYQPIFHKARCQDVRAGWVTPC